MFVNVEMRVFSISLSIMNFAEKPQACLCPPWEVNLVLDCSNIDNISTLSSDHASPTIPVSVFVITIAGYPYKAVILDAR